MSVHSLASLRNFSFTSAEQFLHVFMATLSSSPICTQEHTQTRTYTQ